LGIIHAKNINDEPFAAKIRQRQRALNNTAMNGFIKIQGDDPFRHLPMTPICPRPAIS